MAVRSNVAIGSETKALSGDLANPMATPAVVFETWLSLHQATTNRTHTPLPAPTQAGSNLTGPQGQRRGKPEELTL